MVRESIQRVGFLFRVLTRRKLDVLDLLESDHIRVEMLFFQWRFTRAEEGRAKVFASIKQELLSHAHWEETLFYPACEKVPELKRMATEAAHDHKQIKALLRELSHLYQSGAQTKTQFTDRTASKMRALQEEVERHVSFEENELFPDVRTFMKKALINRLSRDLRIAKQHKSHKIAA